MHDLPLLDEARALVAGPPRPFGHVIVDEAQDLTPLQLRMVARRSANGALTLLGDLAQATGPVVYESWAEVGEHLAGDLRVEELRHAYRVPAQIMDVALPLLPLIAPDVTPPIAYRTGGEPPRIVHAARGAVLADALAQAASFDEGLVAVIAPPSLARGVAGRPRLRRERGAGADGAAGEGARVRPRRRRRARGDRRRGRPARALRRADASDEDARDRPRRAAAATRCRKREKRRGPDPSSGRGRAAGGGWRLARQ